MFMVCNQEKLFNIIMIFPWWLMLEASLQPIRTSAPSQNNKNNLLFEKGL